MVEVRLADPAAMRGAPQRPRHGRPHGGDPLSHNVVSTGDEEEEEDDDSDDGDVFDGRLFEAASVATSDDDDDGEDIDHGGDEDRAYHSWDPSRRTRDDDDGGIGAGDDDRDLLYDGNLDDEDEAYVYRHMRGGARGGATVLEPTRSRRGRTAAASAAPSGAAPPPGAGAGAATTITTAAVASASAWGRPRRSDAVLSCPCCFNIVCMDCQRHRRYGNQFRAMFVMGITVDWHKILRYDDVQQALVPRAAEEEGRQGPWQEDEDDVVVVRPPRAGDGRAPGAGGTVPADLVAGGNGGASASPSRRPPPATGEGEYFAVECANCRTQVAALDMREEVYHFHGCLESSAMGTPLLS